MQRNIPKIVQMWNGGKWLRELCLLSEAVFPTQVMSCDIGATEQVV